MQDKHNSNGFYDLYHNPFTGNSEPRGYTYVAGYGFSPPPRADYERRMIRTYSSGIALMLLCFLMLSGPAYQLLFSLETMLFGRFMTYTGFSVASELANMGAYVLALLLPAVLYCRYIRIPVYNAFPLGRLRDTGITLAAIPITLMTVVVGAYTASVVSALFAVFGLYPTSPMPAVPTNGVEFIFYFISTAILPAIVEELVFRGAIMQSLRRFGDTFALLVSSLLFGLVHGNLVQAPMAFITGLAIGYFVLRTGSLRTGMLVHFINNALATVLSAISAGLSIHAQQTLNHAVYVVYLFGGFVAMGWLLTRYNNMFRLHASNTVMTLRGKLAAFFSAGLMLILLTLLAVTTSKYFLVI